MVLRNCPFSQVAQARPEIICQMNLAFVAGVLAGTQSRSRHAVLSPSTGRCCVVVTSYVAAARTGPSIPCVGGRRDRPRRVASNNTNEYCRYHIWVVDVPHHTSRSRRRYGSGGPTVAVVVRRTHTQHGRGGRDGQTNGSTDSGQGRGCRRGCGGAGTVSGVRPGKWSAADDFSRNHR